MIAIANERAMLSTPPLAEIGSCLPKGFFECRNEGIELRAF